MQTFASKRDGWLTFIVCGTLAVIGLPMVSLVRHGEWPAILMLLAVATLLLWVYLGTRYTVTESLLEIRCGPFRWDIELASITALTPTDDPTSAPACSLDRIEIRYGEGRTILVSPLDKEGFFSAVRPVAGS